MRKFFRKQEMQAVYSKINSVTGIVGAETTLKRTGEAKIQKSSGKFKAFILIVFVGVSQVANAQYEITMLHQNGNSYYFRGANSFVTALDSAANGDTIYLSAGSFNIPAAIDKGVVIIGAGHFPDAPNLRKRTTINAGSSNLNINAGADNLHLEGLYISGSIYFYGGVRFQESASINNVTLKRCRVGNIFFNSSTDSTSKNNCCVEECYIFGGIAQGVKGESLQIIRNVIMTLEEGWGPYVYYSLVCVYNAVIKKNIFLSSGSGYYMYLFSDVKNSVCYGNIFISQPNIPFTNCSNNEFRYNIFTDTNINFSNNTSDSNYMGIPRNSIFVNQTGFSIDYNHDYHLQDTTLYLGNDGTQVGLYGGIAPFKELGRPFNPQVIEKNIGPEALPNGTLPVNIKVQAQDR